mmetsp:Transcript_28284/g.43509  ORF Transcript_28284/g.43509 Transcript_28284/m.43509 type:complete len:81 (-) Transcript_28284:37-279(-)
MVSVIMSSRLMFESWSNSPDHPGSIGSWERQKVLSVAWTRSNDSWSRCDVMGIDICIFGIYVKQQQQHKKCNRIPYAALW